MEKLTIMEKLQIILNSIFASDLLLVIVGFMILALGTYFINKKVKNKLINILLLGSLVFYIAAMIALIAPKVFQVIEVATQEILKQYYFPNMVILITMYIISFSIGVTAILRRKKEKIFSLINIVCFIIINLLYATLASHVIDTKINITMGMLLYQDEQMLAILQMITLIFMIIITMNILLFFASKIAKKIDSMKQSKMKEQIINYE